MTRFKLLTILLITSVAFVFASEGEEYTFDAEEFAFDECAAYNYHKAPINYTAHTFAFHRAIEISPTGDLIKLEDGSLWAVAGCDLSHSLDWMSKDLLCITINNEWFSSYQFIITNQQSGTFVRCNLVKNPEEEGYYTHWITGIDFYKYEIELEDGSKWSLSGYDSSIFTKWKAKDTVIVGINNGFLKEAKPNILINVSKNPLTHVRAKHLW